MIRIIDFGIGLTIFGLLLTLSSYFLIGEISLTAFGLACIIIGITALLTPSSPIPKKVFQSMIEGACVNIEALFEEFNVSEKAIYMPPRDGRVYTFIPISSNTDSFNVKNLMKLPLRVITQVEGNTGLIIFPPVSEIVRLANIEEDSELEEALRLVIVEFLEAAESIKILIDRDIIIIEFSNPKIGIDFPRYNRILGSLVTGLAGCTIGWVLNKPVLFNGEIKERNILRASFKVIS